MNHSRRDFLKNAAAGTAAFMLGQMGCKNIIRGGRPNIIYILADDLGYGELGCYGQKKIRTPNIDSLAENGIRFTQHYSGSPVCAPSRCSLLTGKHTGHGYIRGNDEMNERGDVWHDPELEGQRPLLANTETIGNMLQSAGYITACIGKWGLGGPGTSGHPNDQGFNHYFGYLCQRVAHNYYPTHLWRNREKVELKGNNYLFPHERLAESLDPDDPQSYEKYRGEQYAPDLMTEEALDFIQKNKDDPFFLYYASIIPHVSLQVPDEASKEYIGEFAETPYKGESGYIPNRFPRSTYAAMISRLDSQVGQIIDLVKKLGLEENTLIMFTSDNGPTFAGGVDYEFFKSSGGLKGLKQDLYEGGIRVPMIACWPGRIHKECVTDHVSAFWDVLPTLADLTGAKPCRNINGISFTSTLLDRGVQKEHEYLYWEYFGKLSQAVRMGKWKGVRFYNKEGAVRSLELYNLKQDPSEKNNVAQQYPGIVEKIEKIMSLRKKSVFKKWNFKDDKK